MSTAGAGAAELYFFLLFMVFSFCILMRSAAVEQQFTEQ